MWELADPGLLGPRLCVRGLDSARMTLSVTLTQPASKWMHWTTLRRHSDLF